jgi:ankyrin repeat protein
MSEAKLPERPSLEFLKKLAKERLHDLRRTDPGAKLADALLAVARDHGFSSWRALKAEVERRDSAHVGELVEACATGEVERARRMLAKEPALARAVIGNRPHEGWTVLHEAAQRGQAAIVRLLLEHGADPNAREAVDNTYPLHWAAARGDFAIMGALLDAGGDVHGTGADHAGDVIGWGTFFSEPGRDVRAVADFLVARGARHNIFSALSVGDLDLVRSVVERDPDELERRMSRFEHGITPLQLAVVKKRDDILDLLIELGADLEAEDVHGQTALGGALSLGNQSAARRLQAAGAKPPATIASAEFRGGVAKLAGSTKKIIPMLFVPDVAAALDWYVSIGFTELGRFADDGLVNWGIVSFGGAEVMLNMHGKKGPQSVSLWLYTDRVDELYELFKARQLEAARAQLTGDAGDHPTIEIVQEIYDPPYGGREFCVLDLNGYELFFRQDEGS